MRKRVLARGAKLSSTLSFCFVFLLKVDRHFFLLQKEWNTWKNTKVLPGVMYGMQLAVPKTFLVKVVKHMQLFFFVQFLRILLISVKCVCLLFQSSIIVSWKDLVGGMSRVLSGFVRSHLSNKNSKRNHLHYVKLFT